MNKRSGRYILIISVLCLLVFPQSKTRSCGPLLESDDAMFLLFQKDMPQVQGLESFYYTERFLNTGMYRSDQGYERNCAEWVAFGANAFTTKDVYGVQYNLAPDAFLYSYNTGNWGSLGDNSFIKWLQHRGNKQVIDYMVFAKRLEFLQTEATDPWGDQSKYNPDATVSNGSRYDTLLQVALAKCKSVEPEFLKQRYAYQAIKIMRFISSFGLVNEPYYDSMVVHYYEQYLKDKNTVAAEWAQIAYAVCQADKEKSVLAFLKIFDKAADYKRIIAFENITVGTLDTLEPKIKDKKTLEVIAALRGMHNTGRGMSSINKLYAMNPNSPYLKLLIGREVNKLEDWLLSYEAKGFYPDMREREHNEHSSDTSYAYYAAKNREKDRQYLTQYKQQLVAMLDGGYADKSFIKLAIVRLCHIEHNFKEGAAYLNTIPRLNNEVMELQRDIEQTVSLVYLGDIASPDVQNMLCERLRSIERRLPAKDTNETYTNIKSNGEGRGLICALQLLISKRYQEHGNIVTAALLFKKANLLVNEYYGAEWHDTACDYGKIDYLDKHGTAEDVDRLLALKHKKNKTPFEQYITPVKWPDENIFYDLKGTLLLRQGQFEDALTVFDKMPDSFWETNYQYKDNLRKTNVTSVGTLLPVTNGLGRMYANAGKKAIVADIVALRRKLQTATADTAIANTSFLLANSLYSITYWGKDWMMYSYGRSSVEISDRYSENYKWASYSFEPNTARFGKIYYGCAWAMDMYNKALAHARGNKELAAQCVLMLAHCDKMKHNYLDDLSQSLGISYSGDRPEYRSPYLAGLKKYATTTTFRESVTHCPDVTILY